MTANLDLSADFQTELSHWSNQNQLESLGLIVDPS